MKNKNFSHRAYFVNKIIVSVLLSLLIPLYISAQQPAVKKSEIIENIDGKTYYMHFIKQGETLYEITRVYDISEDEIISINPNAKSGIKAGQILKIPFTEPKENNNTPWNKNSGYFLYTVKSKETLYGIAKKFNTDIDDIKNINTGMGASLKEGQVIKIPGTAQQTKNDDRKEESKKIKHIVKTGETLYAISRQYDISVYEIKKSNPGLVENLKTGQEITIPLTAGSQTLIKETSTVPSVQKSSKTHVVASGETLYSISRLYSVDPDSLKKYNPNLKETLFIGQFLTIPDKSRQKNYIYHTAEKNDKLQTLAEKYGVSYSELSALNPDLVKKINKGQKVKIPVQPEEVKTIPQEAPENETESFKDKNCNNQYANNQNSYNVALMLPLYLELVDSIVSSAALNSEDYKEFQPFRFIQFYEGFMMAVDSMNKAGLKMNLHVYDVDNSTHKINSVLNKSELKNMDLIIGPFFSDSFKKSADFAKNNEIKIVNPISTREEIVNGNPFVFKLKPSVAFQSEQLVTFILDKYPESNVILLRQSKYKYQEEVSYIKNYLNSQRNSSAYINNRALIRVLDSLKTDKMLTDNTFISRESLSKNPNESTYFSSPVKEIVTTDDASDKLKSTLSGIRNNIIIVLSDEKVYCQEIMSQLNKLIERYKITIVGLPEWYKFSDLQSQYLNNMNAHFFVPSLVNFNDPDIRKWIEKFRKSYATEPSAYLYAFDGFDAGWYFLNALFRYGNDFEKCLDDLDIRLIQTEFRFENLKGNGYQNIYWNIGKHLQYKFIPANQ